MCSAWSDCILLFIVFFGLIKLQIFYSLTYDFDFLSFKKKRGGGMIVA